MSTRIRTTPSITHPLHVGEDWWNTGLPRRPRTTAATHDEPHPSLLRHPATNHEPHASLLWHPSRRIATQPGERPPQATTAVPPSLRTGVAIGHGLTAPSKDLPYYSSSVRIGNDSPFNLRLIAAVDGSGNDVSAAFGDVAAFDSVAFQYAPIPDSAALFLLYLPSLGPGLSAVPLTWSGPMTVDPSTDFASGPSIPFQGFSLAIVGGGQSKAFLGPNVATGDQNVPAFLLIVVSRGSAATNTAITDLLTLATVPAYLAPYGAVWGPVATAFVWSIHNMPLDADMVMCGIPWTYGLVSEEFSQAAGDGHGQSYCNVDLHLAPGYPGTIAVADLDPPVVTAIGQADQSADGVIVAAIGQPGSGTKKQGGTNEGTTKGAASSGSGSGSGGGTAAQLPWDKKRGKDIKLKYLRNPGQGPW